MTIKPNAAYHSIYFGALRAAPFSIKSKAKTGIQRRDNYDEQAKTDTNDPGTVDELQLTDAEKTEKERHQINKHDPTGRGSNAQFEILGRFDESGSVSNEQTGQRAKG